MHLFKRLRKKISPLLVLCISVFCIQLEQQEQYAFFSWEYEEDIPWEGQIDRQTVHSEHDILCPTQKDILRGNFDNASMDVKNTGVHRNDLPELVQRLFSEQTRAVQMLAAVCVATKVPDCRHCIISYIYHQNGEHHSESPYFPVSI